MCGTVAAVPAGGDPGASDRPPTAAGDALPSPAPPALEKAARPLRTIEPTGPFEDLRPFGRAVGDAVVVGIGEAAHGSHDFVAFRHRVLRYLVEEKGFRSFVLEANWSAGARLDDHLLTGRGDPARIMSEEFQDAYLLLHSQEYLDMIRWMRAYNVAHPGDPLRFAGDDSSHAGPELYDRVVDHVRHAHPDLLPTVTRLYRGLRPTLPAGAWMRAVVTAPLDERRAAAERTGRVLELLRAREPAGRDGGHDLTVQHARVIDQVARLYALRPQRPPRRTAGHGPPRHRHGGEHSCGGIGTPATEMMLGGKHQKICTSALPAQPAPRPGRGAPAAPRRRLPGGGSLLRPGRRARHRTGPAEPGRRRRPAVRGGATLARLGRAPPGPGGPPKLVRRPAHRAAGRPRPAGRHPAQARDRHGLPAAR
ncbi:conserved hypothetical protein [Streptomyces griseoflavus Tu4000]|uniref:Erythromycin esterase n=1 Tax=Streptomyces griseoflavus Tu4000 TaxID=467200 RepID=D9XZ39_9ACTN|nr:conserved hypothetical protein [Streptomyces griseoflavus Tu4000]